MFSHIMVGANDIAGAKTFYDAVLGPLGIAPGMLLGETRVMYRGNGAPLMVTKPANGEPACHANGGTIGLYAANPEAVDAAYAAGMADGGTCEGKPGPREAFPGSYGAYLRDQVGNKICLWHMPQA